MISTKNTPDQATPQLEGLKIQPTEGRPTQAKAPLTFEKLQEVAQAARMRIGGERGGAAHLAVKTALRKAA